MVCDQTFTCVEDSGGEDDGAEGSESAGETTTSSDGGDTTSGGDGDGGAACEPMGGLLDDPDGGIGSPECDACAMDSCCSEYEAYEAGGSVDAVVECARNNCTECHYPVCDAMSDGLPVGLMFLSGCAECLGTNCCELFSYCVADQWCFECLNSFGQGSDCGVGSLYEQYEACRSLNCDTAATCEGLAP